MKDLEQSLLELHQIFLDMAVLVEAQVGGMAGWVTRGREGGLTRSQVEGGGSCTRSSWTWRCWWRHRCGGWPVGDSREGGWTNPLPGRGGGSCARSSWTWQCWWRHGHTDSLTPSCPSAGRDAGQHPEAGGAQRGLRQGRHGGARGREEAAEEHEKGLRESLPPSPRNSALAELSSPACCPHLHTACTPPLLTPPPCHLALHSFKHLKCTPFS